MAKDVQQTAQKRISYALDCLILLVKRRTLRTPV